MDNLEKNLEVNLEKLQIGEVRMERYGNADLNPFAVGLKQPLVSSSIASSSAPDTAFQSLCLYGRNCSSSSCSCQRKKSQTSALVRKTSFKLKKSRLGPIGRRRVLRPAVLQLRDSLALARPIDSPAIASHLASLDLSSAGGKVLGVGGLSDFRSLVSVDVSKFDWKALARFDAVSFIELRTKRDKHFLVGLRAPRRRTYSDSTALTVAPATSDATDTDRRRRAPCALQARMASPDDTSIDELASYFDLFVHIPKKMSRMAEMMYI